MPSYTLIISLLAATATAFNINPNAVGATADVQVGSGPNGYVANCTENSSSKDTCTDMVASSEDWLNTGIADGSGWNPPFLSLDSISHITSTQFYNGAGSACRKYDSMFQSAGKKYAVDPAILAMIGKFVRLDHNQAHARKLVTSQHSLTQQRSHARVIMQCQRRW